jgi:hypothetical protein
MENNLPSDIWWCDDIIPKITQQRFKEYVMQPSFDWNDFNHILTCGAYFDVPYVISCNEVNVKQTDALIKLIYANNGIQEHILVPTAYWLAISILDEYAKRNNVKIVDIIRMKINNLSSSMYDTYDETCCNEIHVDNEVPNNKSLVYYINDSDGDTFLFDKLFDGKTAQYDTNILMRVAPLQGRAVVFDTWRFHAPSNPIHSRKRIILNINFIEKKL